MGLFKKTKNIWPYMKKKCPDIILQNDFWSSPYMNSLWSETTETWTDTPSEDWRIVGTNPFKKRSKSINDILLPPSPEELYLVEFSSSRIELAYSSTPDKAIEIGSYVIIEADRGEDCGYIVGRTSYKEVDNLRNKYGLLKNETQIKKIYRSANKLDMKVLEKKKMMEEEAFKICSSIVERMGLDMLLKGCEYQFDMNKLTFYYESGLRIDFRDLVKELYKLYKTRIWMCSIEKSKNRCLREII